MPLDRGLDPGLLLGRADRIDHEVGGDLRGEGEEPLGRVVGQHLGEHRPHVGGIRDVELGRHGRPAVSVERRAAKTGRNRVAVSAEGHDFELIGAGRVGTVAPGLLVGEVEP